MHDPPDSRVRADEQGVAALQEAVHQENQRYSHGGRSRVAVWVSVIL